MLSDSIDLIDLIANGRNNAYNNKQCSLLTKIGDSVLTVGGLVFDRYIDFIKDACVRIKLNDDEMLKYKYNPKKLSLDLYNTEELWFLILRLNNMGSEIEFKPKRIYVLDPKNISLLNKILILNDETIALNHHDIYEE